MTQQERIDSIFVLGQFEKDFIVAKKSSKQFKLPGSKIAMSQQKLDEFDYILSGVDDSMDEIIAPSHQHKLKKHPKGHHNGWRCDKIKGVQHCLSGMYDFYQSTQTTPTIYGW